MSAAEVVRTILTGGNLGQRALEEAAVWATLAVAEALEGRQAPPTPTESPEDAEARETADWMASSIDLNRDAYTITGAAFGRPHRPTMAQVIERAYRLGHQAGRKAPKIVSRCQRCGSDIREDESTSPDGTAHLDCWAES